MTKQAGLGAVLGLVTLMLAACSGSSSPTSTASSSSSSGGAVQGVAIPANVAVVTAKNAN
jgi:hypothetical protein